MFVYKLQDIKNPFTKDIIYKTAYGYVNNFC